MLIKIITMKYKKSKITPLCLIAVLAIAINCSAVTLGFNGPSRMINPGEVFDVAVVAYFDESEVAGWSHSPLLNVTVLWPGGVYVLDCEWNNEKWDFDLSNTHFEQTETSSLFWARATAKEGAINPGAGLVIAQLKCVGTEYEDDAFIYDIFTNYYGVCSGNFTDDLNCDVIYTNNPTSMTYDDIDVLGNSDVEDDGLDEFPILITEKPGYTLSVVPTQREIPFAVKATDIDFIIGGTEGAPGFDHVRVVMDFDSSVLSNVSVEVIPDFFFSTTTTAIVGRAITCTTNQGGFINCQTSIVEQIIAEGFCSVTNFGGIFAKIKMLPIDIDETYLEFYTEDKNIGTVIDKFGVVDLLGAADDEDDGFFDAELNIRYADGLCVAFEPLESIGIIDNQCWMKVMLQKSTEGDIILDEINLKTLFNSLQIESNSIYFNPSPQILSSGADFSFNIFSNNIYEYESYLSNNFRHTDYISRLIISWTNTPLFVSSNNFELGTITFIPMTPGETGFVYGNGSVEYLSADFSDENAWAVNWPATIPIVSESDSENQFFVEMVLDTNDVNSTKPGSEITLSVVAYGSSSNVTYNLNWLYDSSVVELMPNSAKTKSINLNLNDGSSATALNISGNSVDLLDVTNILAVIKLKALRAGDAILKPVIPEFSTNDFCIMTDNGLNDILGSANVAGDGISEYRLVIKEGEDVFLNFNPAGSLYAGIATNIVLSVNNPLNSKWNEVSAEIEFDPDEIVAIGNKWEILLNEDEIEKVEENLIENILTPTGFTNSYGKEITNRTTVARIHFFTKNPVTNSTDIAAIKMFALEDEPFWEFNIGTGMYDYTYTRVAYNGVLKINDDRIEETDWNVYPNGIGIWLNSPQTPPVIGTNYTLTVSVGNPHNFDISQINLCWSFDAYQLEVSSVKLIDGFSTNSNGGIWINNNNDGDGYICAKLISENATHDSIITPLEITISPKLNEIIEIIPDEDVFPDDREISMGVWSVYGNSEEFNLINTLGQDATDVCPEWRRGVVWFPIPQLVFDDIYLDVNESYVIEDLLDDSEGLVNGSPDKNYTWWVEGNNHISVSFNQALNSATVIPEHNWFGEEIIDVYCQESGSPFVGHTKLRVVVGEDEMDFNISVDREDYITSTDYDFEKVYFNVLNETNPVIITATAISTDGTTNYPDVIDAASGEIITNAKVWTRGYLSWRTPKTPGILRCRITGRVYRLHDSTPPTAYENFYVDVQRPYEDDDGDRFLVLYNRQPIFPDARSIIIKNGSNRDKLKIKLITKKGDGLIKLDCITSDAGIKNIFIPGSVNLIDTKGPIGKVRIFQGSVGMINVAEGGICSIIVDNPFHKKEEDFMDAGIVKGITCNGNIDSIVVKGGDIGLDDEPAEIKVVNGELKRIIATLNVKTIHDGGKDIYALGGNIFANIDVSGNIGEISAVGGSVGTDFDDVVSTIKCGANIKKIKAVSKKGDFEVLGGYIHSNIICEKNINQIIALGGDILGTVEVEPEDIGYETLDYGVYINAKAINKIICYSKCNLFKEGRNKVDDWYWETYGGSVGANINLAGSSNSSIALKRLISKGGSLCVYVDAKGDIGNVRTKTIKWREYLDDEEFIFRGGDVFSSAFLPNVVYKSSVASDYEGKINKIKIPGKLYDSWIGMKGPFPKKIKIDAEQLIGNSEIWVDAVPYLKAQ